MRRERLHLQGGMSVEAGRDWNGRFFIAHAHGAAVFIRDAKLLRRWLKLPLKTPSREALDSWLASLGAADAPAAPDGLSAEHVATGFGPECHGVDETDPNHQTRTVI